MRRSGRAVAGNDLSAYPPIVLVRILLALLIAAFAVPAAAVAPSCHGGSAAMTHTTAGEHHRPDRAPPAHVCVGCVPVADWLGERIAPPFLPAAIGPVATIARLDRAGDTPPALPPPRHG